MNNQWIRNCHIGAERYRKESWWAVDGLDIYAYLDTIGLFETCWMIYDFDDCTDRDRIMYGYPSDE